MDPETVDLLKSGPVDKLSDLLHKLAGPAFEELGLMFGDKVRAYRTKNLTRVTQKTECILINAELPVKPVPPRLLLPIIEHSSIEDHDTLQDMWAGLLASASNTSDSVSPSYAETLKQLTPVEARFLEYLYSEFQSRQHHNRPINPFEFTVQGGAPTGISADNFERLGLIERDLRVNWKDIVRSASRASTVERAIDEFASSEPGIEHCFLLSGYAVRFLKACHGPQKHTSAA